MQIFRTRMTTHEDFCDSGLKRALSAFDLTFLGIGAIIGTGIFVLTGIAAATMSGPAVVLSFVVSGIACAFAALAYAELAASLGGCGSAYGYSYAALGELVAWLVGWMLILEYGVATAAVANGWSGYFNNALTAVGLPLPDALTRAPSQGGIINLPAAGIVVALSILLIIGVKQSSQFNTVLVFVKLLTIAVFVGVAVFHVNPALWDPFLPFGWFNAGAEGKPVGVLAGAAIVFFAYIGFDAVTTAAEEARNPQRDVPIGLLASLAICTVIYVVVSGLLTGIVSYKDLNVSSPVAHAMQLLGINWASALIATGVITGLTTVMLVLYYGLTRIFFAMSRDGLLPPFFGAVNANTQTPVRVIVLCGALIALTAGFVPLGDLAELVNIGTLSAFVMVCIGAIVLRSTQPQLKRPFKTPYHPLIPVLGILSCGVLLASLPHVTWKRFGIWMLIGIIFYFVYSMRNSRLANLTPQT
ncbi:MAG: amino acid permease [Gammaproteobacteria bacterium]|nr:amino acid permease [Gammaproteobacteria bacterium]